MTASDDRPGRQTCRLVWLAPGAEAEYERLHREVPAEIGDRLRRRGIHDYSIFRHGNLLINVLRQGPPIDLSAVERGPEANLAVEQQWEASLAPLFARTVDEAGGPIMAERVFRWR